MKQKETHYASTKFFSSAPTTTTNNPSNSNSSAAGSVIFEGTAILHNYAETLDRRRRTARRCVTAFPFIGAFSGAVLGTLLGITFCAIRGSEFSGYAKAVVILASVGLIAGFAAGKSVECGFRLQSDNYQESEEEVMPIIPYSHA